LQTSANKLLNQQKQRGQMSVAKAAQADKDDAEELEERKLSVQEDMATSLLRIADAMEASADSTDRTAVAVEALLECYEANVSITEVAVASQLTSNSIRTMLLLLESRALKMTMMIPVLTSMDYYGIPAWTLRARCLRACRLYLLCFSFL
jgi:hypothetical protein